MLLYYKRQKRPRCIHEERTSINIIKKHEPKVSIESKHIFDDISLNARRKVVLKNLFKEYNTLRSHRQTARTLSAQNNIVHQWDEVGWLHSRGKGKSRHENSKRLSQLRQWFDFLDRDGSGEVEPDELLDPLISLGLAETREEVLLLVSSVCSDGDLRINFQEFQALFKYGSSNNGSHSKQKEVARLRMLKLFEGETDFESEAELPFSILVTSHRRQMLLDANMAPHYSATKRRGTSVLGALVKSKEVKEQVVHKNSRPIPTTIVKPGLSRGNKFRLTE